MTADGTQPSPAALLQARVRDALLHLYDVPYLQTHPLANLLGTAADKSPALRGKTLFRTLVNAIEALSPSGRTKATARSLRTYRLLELRYIEGLSASEVMRQLAISKTEYQREHVRGLAAVASVLADHLRPEDGAGASLSERETMVLQEAEQVVSGASPESIDLGDLLAELLALLHSARQNGQASISLVRQPNLAPIYGHRAALRQVFLGLLSAALERSAGGDVRVVLQGAESVVQVRICAAPPRPTAVERRARAGEETAIVRQLLKAVGGTMAVAPPTGEAGWTVTVELRAARRSRVLVVDNHAEFIALVARYLVEHDWEVVGADDVGQAQVLALEHPPDVVLLDLMMPGRDGWDFLVALKSRPETKDVPVIICSVLHEPEIAKALGAAGYLAKPVSQASLLEALAPWQRNRRGQTPS